MSTETQVCNKCKKDLPLDNFNKLASGKGHYKKCIACASTAEPKHERQPKIDPSVADITKKAKNNIKYKNRVITKLSQINTLIEASNQAVAEDSKEQFDKCRKELAELCTKLNEMQV
jgi:hypothetical protein